MIGDGFKSSKKPEVEEPRWSSAKGLRADKDCDKGDMTTTGGLRHSMHILLCSTISRTRVPGHSCPNKEQLRSSPLAKEPVA